MLYFTAKRIVFDKREGYVWKGIREPGEAHKGGSPRYLATIEDIHALQLISEYHSSSGDEMAGFRSYELNLVMKDGRRVNVVCHGWLEKIRMQASTLSEFLGKPVWDAI